MNRGAGLRDVVWLLTPTQRRVLQLAAGGCSCQETANALDIHIITVRNHLAHIYKRLGVVGRVAGVLEGIRLGEIDALQAYEDLEFRRRVEIKRRTR